NYYKYNSYIKKLIVDIEIDIDNILSSKDTGINIGAYNGISQYIKYYIDLYSVKKVKFDYFLDRIDKLVNKIHASLEKDKKLDILDGTAGVSMTLIALLDINIPEKLREKVIALISKCHDHLINSIIIRDGEYYFPTEQDKEKFFTGFAHGTSGITMALYKAGKILSIDNSKIIEKIIETERKYYNKVDKCWYRDNSKKDISWGWCHGVPGILLSRVELFSDGYRDKYLLNEIEELYKITIHESLGTNLTFCHGDPGNLTICKYVQRKLSFIDEDLDNYIKSLIFCIINSEEYCIRGNEAPGLVQGKMGIVNFINADLKNDFDPLFDIIMMTSK
ncbi:lantibiotic mersacidin modifying enzyme, partial [Lactococcus piscium]